MAGQERATPARDAGLAGGDLLWQRAGMTADALLYPALAIIAVLAGGEWLSRRVQRRLY